MNEEEYEEYVSVMRQAEMAESRGKEALEYGEVVLDAYWQDCKTMIKDSYEGNYEDEDFLNTIWEISTGHLDAKEVSVIVDRNDKLFISKGTSSFVDYKNEDVSGMAIPFKCWIHTHPFGVAYFSGTDWGTINAQMPILDSAIVLGNMERMKWWKKGEKFLLSKTNLIALDDSEE
tara:strand:- start:13483 stop:14007 length:525 start_codon:yes stop_codon:yes gene_type:complete